MVIVFLISFRERVHELAGHDETSSSHAKALIDTELRGNMHECRRRSATELDGEWSQI
jgi:hypothetical protein